MSIWACDNLFIASENMMGDRESGHVVNENDKNKERRMVIPTGRARPDIKDGDKIRFGLFSRYLIFRP